jgi:hypothetical protein
MLIGARFEAHLTPRAGGVRRGDPGGLQDGVEHGPGRNASGRSGPGRWWTTSASVTPS